MAHKGKAPPNTHATTKNLGGRPARPMPELIPDTPENIARASMNGTAEETMAISQGKVQWLMSSTLPLTFLINRVP